MITEKAGEEVILVHLIEQISNDILNLCRLKTTYFSYSIARELEYARIEEFEMDLIKQLQEMFPFHSSFSRHGPPLSSFTNYTNCWVQDCIQYWGKNCMGDQPRDIDKILQGWSREYYYRHFEEALKLSNSVLKDCVGRLEQKGRLKRKRGMQGYAYFLYDKRLPEALHAKRKETEWYPVSYSNNRELYESDSRKNELKEAIHQCGKEIQDYFEELVEVCIHNLELEQQKINLSPSP